MVDLIAITQAAFYKYLSIFPYLVIAYIIIYALRRVNLRQKLKRLGKRHRMLAAYLIGVLSHGNIYMWYPILQELGFDEDEIAVILYNRAIKIPQIPLQLALFGWKFTLLLNGFILATSVIYGKLTKFFVSLVRKSS